MTANKEKTTKTKRMRSPNYPAISLKKAIDLALMIYDFAKTHSIPERIAHQKFGVKEYGSQGAMYIAALKAYGLINVTGSGKDRKIAVTEDMRHIHLDSSQKPSILKKLALKPKIFREVWEYYYGELPDNKRLAEHLALTKGFNESSTGNFISNFRSTISLANLDQTDIMTSEVEKFAKDDEELYSEHTTIDEMETEKRPAQPQSYTSTGINRRMNELRNNQDLQEIRFPLTNGDVHIFFPTTMDEDDFETVKVMLEAQRKIMNKRLSTKKDETE